MQAVYAAAVGSNPPAEGISRKSASARSGWPFSPQARRAEAHDGRVQPAGIRKGENELNKTSGTLSICVHYMMLSQEEGEHGPSTQEVQSRQIAHVKEGL